MAKKRAKKAKKEQWLSFNKAISLLLALALLVIFKTSLTPSQDTKLPEEEKANLAGEAEIVLDKLAGGHAEVSVLDSDGLMEEKVIDLEQRDYNEIKSMLGVKNDFCLFFEDATGNLVRIDGIDSGIGSDKIHVNGEPCG